MAADWQRGQGYSVNHNFEGAAIFSGCLGELGVRSRGGRNRNFSDRREEALGRRIEPWQGAQDSRFRGDLRVVGRGDQSLAGYSARPQRAMVAEARPAALGRLAPGAKDSAMVLAAGDRRHGVDAFLGNSAYSAEPLGR